MKVIPEPQFENAPYPPTKPANSKAVRLMKDQLKGGGYRDHTDEHLTNIMVHVDTRQVADLRKIASGTASLPVFQYLSDAALSKLYVEQGKRTLDEYNEEDNKRKAAKMWVISLGNRAEHIPTDLTHYITEVN